MQVEISPVILIIDHDRQRAQVLMDAVQSYRSDTRFTLKPDLDQAHHTFYEQEYSIVVLRPEISERDLKDFVAFSRKTEGGKDSAYVLLVEKEGQNQEAIALGMLAEVNGFLFSPFSVQGVKETFDLARKLKIESIERVQKDGMKNALKSAKEHIDLLASALREDPELLKKSNGREVIFESVRQAITTNPDLFYRMVVGSFIWETKNAPTVGGNSYRGSSPRIKRLMAAKAAETLRDKTSTASPESSNDESD
jgi:hypothetical protein